MTMYPPLMISVDQESVPSPSQSSFKKPVEMKETKPIMRRPVTDCGDNSTGESGAKKISFGKRVKIKKIRSHKLYSQSERDAIWHTESEMASIKQGCIQTLREMMKYSFKECDEICPRGLEIRTKEASMARKHVRLLAAQMVFEEQELQRDWGERNDERIRESYQEISKEAHHRAHCMALRDENISRNYLSR